jgi:hypothetical protein
MTINKDELYRLYMEKVNRIAEDCDWVTSFGPEEIVNMIANILENNPQLITDDDSGRVL